MNDPKNMITRLSEASAQRLKSVAQKLPKVKLSRTPRFPDRIPRRHIPGQRKTVGIIISSDSGLANSAILRGAERVLKANGYEPVYRNAGNSQQHELRCLRELYMMNVRGLIIDPSKSHMLCHHKSFYDKLSDENIPWVFINSSYPQMSESPVITNDDSHGAYLLTRHLIATGRERIAAFFSSDDNRGYLRHAGYVRALQEAGLQYIPEIVIWFHSEDKKKKPVIDLEQILRTDKGCDSVMCYSDDMAVEIIMWLRDNGYEVPYDISVTGYGNTYTAGAGETGLTTVALPDELMGLFAAELLIEKFKGVNDSASLVERLLAPELVIRNSSITDVE